MVSPIPVSYTHLSAFIEGNGAGAAGGIVGYEMCIRDRLHRIAQQRRHSPGRAELGGGDGLIVICVPHYDAR